METKTLRKKILDSGMSIADVAKRSGVSNVCVYNLLAGAGVRIQTLESVCNTIGISPASLFGDSRVEQEYKSRIAELEARLEERQDQIDTLLKLINRNENGERQQQHEKD